MKRSMMASAVSAFFRLKKKPTQTQAEDDLSALMKAGEAASRPPKKPPTRHTDGPAGRVFYVNEDSSSRYTVFYIHGGAYQHDFSPFHWRFIDKLKARTGAAVIAPAYRLIPFGTWKDAYDLIVPLYEAYTEKHPGKKIILMGDSAGGGLALALSECFRERHSRMPDETILLSPWVDVTMENPEIASYQGKDPWLTVPWLTVCGKHWAGGLDTHDKRVSPLYGDLRGQRNVTVFTGTREILYPDTRKFFDRIRQEETNELIVGEEMIHVYPLIPIPEARPAMETIVAKVLR